MADMCHRDAILDFSNLVILKVLNVLCSIDVRAMTNRSLDRSSIVDEKS